MKPGYIPSPEEEEEATQTIMAFHAWMLGLPDPRERIPLGETAPRTPKDVAVPPTDTSRHPRG